MQENNNNQQAASKNLESTPELIKESPFLGAIDVSYFRIMRSRVYLSHDGKVVNLIWLGGQFTENSLKYVTETLGIEMKLTEGYTYMEGEKEIYSADDIGSTKNTIVKTRFNVLLFR